MPSSDAGDKKTRRAVERETPSVTLVNVNLIKSQKIVISLVRGRAIRLQDLIIKTSMKNGVILAPAD